MKRIARLLRHTADRIDPAGQNPIVDLQASWSRTEPPHINLELIGGNRMCGYVHTERDIKHLAAQAKIVNPR